MSSNPLLNSPPHNSTSHLFSHLGGPPGRRDLVGLSQASLPGSISNKYSLAADPSTWGSALTSDKPEPDDHLHNPNPRRDKLADRGSLVTARGLQNVGCLILLACCLIGLFLGYPVVSYVVSRELKTFGAFNVGGLNASGQVPEMSGGRGLIDPDTPTDAYFKYGYYKTDKRMQLVFSDEFNTEGRTFYPGDDPYWEAVDMHYWSTNNLEWYDPEGIITRNGSAEITLDKRQIHDMDYMGGMMSTWNKFCFTGGLIEAAISLPGSTTVRGLWPAVWMMGNLGRAGYGATLEGTWPYVYDSCDVGTASNQTKNGLPTAATTMGDQAYHGVLSYLPGQRLSRCTCPGEEHPGPMHQDGTYVGRAAPEIDFFEAQVVQNQTSGEFYGQVSQSAQYAPFNANFEWYNQSNSIIPDLTVTELNGFKGNVFQQALSAVSTTNQECYQLTGQCYAVYGVEYRPGFDDAYISWINDGKVAWTMLVPGVAADTVVEISDRPVPPEPMYLLANLGISENFGTIDYDKLTWPAVMKIDYIRVYQPEDEVNVGCDPKDYPTMTYIERFKEAYINPNLTTWVDDYKQKVPKNSFTDGCE